MSWREFVHGMRHLTREGARENLRAYTAARFAQSVKPKSGDDPCAKWVAKQNLIAGW